MLNPVAMLATTAFRTPRSRGIEKKSQPDSLQPRYPDAMNVNPPVNASLVLTLGGRVRCRQCSARSKRTGVQCRSPALRGKAKCRMHGGRSTGPKTVEGRARIAAAHLLHGRETRKARCERSLAIARLTDLEDLIRCLGLIEGRYRWGWHHGR